MKTSAFINKNCKQSQDSCLILKPFKKFIKIIPLMICLIISVPEGSLLTAQEANDTIKFYDGQLFHIIGKFHAEKNYVRFPQEYKSTLREEVWGLGQHSAGISIRFSTNSPDIVVRWTSKGDNIMDHMAFTGIKGVDLYAIVDGRWKYLNTGRVKGKVNEFVLVRSEDEVYREYLLNLPLYDGIDSLSIGIDRNAEITGPKENYLIAKKPVVYYGSSIAQGGCASRPGMAFTNILERAMDRSFINMGFSGNGTLDLSVGEAMCEIDAALYVIDCNPNTLRELIYDRTIELVKLLKHKRPDIPVLLVEGFYYENGFVKPEDSITEKKRVELRRALRTLEESGIKNLYYKKGDGLIGYDNEGTVDGVHPNDLGMHRIAEALQPAISKILEQ
jgi:hypothetical protein